MVGLISSWLIEKVPKQPKRLSIAEVESRCQVESASELRSLGFFRNTYNIKVKIKPSQTGCLLEIER